MRHTGFALMVGAVCLAMPEAGASAQTSAPGEAGFVMSVGSSPLFAEVLRHRAPLSAVASDGAVGDNIRRYEHAAHQRDVIWLVMRALIANDDEAMQKVVQALEYGFAQQTAEGYFRNAVGVSPVRAVGADAFFLQGYCRIQLVVMNSKFRSAYAPRFEAMNAHLPRALDWLKQNQGELFRQDRNATNRLFFDAMALGLCGEVADDAEALALGRDVFVKAGLANLRADGTFEEHGGYDSSYQAVSLLGIAGLVQNLDSYPRDSLMQAFDRAARWQKTRIEDTGRVATEGNARTGVGREGNKEVNYFEVIVALYYAGYLLDEPEYIRLGNTVSEFVLRTIN